MLLTACGSASQEPSSSTTIDPTVEELQEKVESLEERLNATSTTVIPPSTTQKPAPKIVDVRRFFSGYTKFDQHECREIFIYSDGTEFESPRRWVTTTKNSAGFKQYDC